MSWLCFCATKEAPVQPFIKEKADKQQPVPSFAFHEDIYKNGTLVFRECEFRDPIKAITQADEFYRLLPAVGNKSSIYHSVNTIQVIFDCTTQIILAISADCRMIQQHSRKLLGKTLSSLFEKPENLQKELHQRITKIHEMKQRIQLNPNRFSADKSRSLEINLLCFFGKTLGVAIIEKNPAINDLERILIFFERVLKADHSAAAKKEAAAKQESSVQSQYSPGSGVTASSTGSPSKHFSRYHVSPLLIDLNTHQPITALESGVQLTAAASGMATLQHAHQAAANPLPTMQALRRNTQSQSKLYGTFLSPKDTLIAHSHTLHPAELPPLHPSAPVGAMQSNQESTVKIVKLPRAPRLRHRTLPPPPQPQSATVSSQPKGSVTANILNTTGDGTSDLSKPDKKRFTV